MNGCVEENWSNIEKGGILMKYFHIFREEKIIKEIK